MSRLPANLPVQRSAVLLARAVDAGVDADTVAAAEAFIAAVRAASAGEANLVHAIKRSR